MGKGRNAGRRAHSRPHAAGDGILGSVDRPGFHVTEGDRKKRKTMRHYLAWTALAAAICFTSATALPADKLSDLRVSENGRFLVRKDGSGFFPLADTAWAIAWRLNRGEVE